MTTYETWAGEVAPITPIAKNGSDYTEAWRAAQAIATERGDFVWLVELMPDGTMHHDAEVVEPEDGDDDVSLDELMQLEAESGSAGDHLMAAMVQAAINGCPDDYTWEHLTPTDQARVTAMSRRDCLAACVRAIREARENAEEADQ